MSRQAKTGASFRVIKAIIFDASDVLYDHSGINKRMFELIAELSQKYKLGMITNLSNSSLDSHFTQEQQKLFDYIHTYGKSGLAKPDPEVFIHAATELEAAAADCIYIDDMYTNVSGAEEAGMQTIVYRQFDVFDHQLKQILKAHE